MYPADLRSGLSGYSLGSEALEQASWGETCEPPYLNLLPTLGRKAKLFAVWTGSGGGWKRSFSHFLSLLFPAANVNLATILTCQNFDQGRRSWASHERGCKLSSVRLIVPRVNSIFEFLGDCPPIFLRTKTGDPLSGHYLSSGRYLWLFRVGTIFHAVSLSGLVANQLLEGASKLHPSKSVPLQLGESIQGTLI